MMKYFETVSTMTDQQKDAVIRWAIHDMHKYSLKEGHGRTYGELCFMFQQLEFLAMNLGLNRVKGAIESWGKKVRGAL